MKKLLIMSLLLPILVACKPTNEKAIEIAQKEVSQDMKDPDSTKFRFTRVVKTKENSDGTILYLVCGQVNSKNSYGAYAGYHSFMIDISLKSKGMLSKGVNYNVGNKQLSADNEGSDIIGYDQLCGPDQ